MTPQDVANGLANGRITLIDIREIDEYSREHIDHALHIPLSALEKGGIELEVGKDVVFHCRSGHRTDMNCAQLAAHVNVDAAVMAGGLNAWKTANLPTIANKSAPIAINRQVQITAGSLVLLGIMLGYFVNPYFYALSGFVGAGLTFAGLSGTCAMASRWMVMPWNRKAAQ